MFEALEERIATPIIDCLVVCKIRARISRQYGIRCNRATKWDIGKLRDPVNCTHYQNSFKNLKNDKTPNINTQWENIKDNVLSAARNNLGECVFKKPQ